MLHLSVLFRSRVIINACVVMREAETHRPKQKCQQLQYKGFINENQKRTTANKGRELNTKTHEMNQEKTLQDKKDARLTGTRCFGKQPKKTRFTRSKPQGPSRNTTE